jgi:catechol 2,3-dioxygenase-like lactoylglutathione lyase family enzyme
MQYRQRLAHIALIVDDYDEAIHFYTKTLDFDLIADTYLPDQDKRWVLVSPPGGQLGFAGACYAATR